MDGVGGCFLSGAYGKIGIHVQLPVEIGESISSFSKSGMLRDQPESCDKSLNLRI